MKYAFAIFAVWVAVLSFMYATAPASACPAGTHPYGGTGSHHAGGGCS